ncbi:MAG: hypothetical protein AAGI17_02160 [Planctomycetota bacterium]
MPGTARSLSIVTSFALIVVCLGGCAQYTVPGGPADFRALGVSVERQAQMTDWDLADEFDRQPAASFPARVAVVRLQDRGYAEWDYSARKRGSVSVVTRREVETDEHFERVNSLEGIAQIAMLNSFVLPDRVSSVDDLRASAAAVQADMLLAYTLDTRFGVEKVVPFLGEITLGIFPAKESRVTSTASAVLLDTRTGYIYGLAEGTSKTSQLANAWTKRDAVEQSRRRAEREAFDALVGEIETMWGRTYSAFERANEVVVEPAAEGG